MDTFRNAWYIMKQESSFFSIRDSFIPVLSVSLKGRNSIRYHVEEVMNME